MRFSSFRLSFTSFLYLFPWFSFVLPVCSFCAAYFNEGCTRQETFVCDNLVDCKEACCKSAAADGVTSADSDDMFGMWC